MAEKILLLSDPQFHNYKANSTLIGGVNSRLLDIENAWETAVKQGIEAGCELCLICGDVFEVRGSIRPSVFNRVFGLMQWMASKMRVVMIAGNHDMEHYRGGDTAIDAFGAIHGVTVLKPPYEFESVKGYRVFGIPYIHKIDEFKVIYEEICSENPDASIIMIHQGIDDFDLTGHIPETGVTVDYLKEHKPKDAWVFSGHYHTPKQDGKIVMIGAPVQHMFSDEGMERGYMIFDGTKIQYKPLSAPQFVTITKKKDLHAAGGNFVRVQAKRLADANKLAEAAKEAGALSVTCRVEKIFATAHEKTIKVSSDVRKMLTDYIEIMDEKYDGKGPAILKKFEEICL